MIAVFSLPLVTAIAFVAILRLVQLCLAKLKKKPFWQCVDIISQLPDDILVSVLSRMSTKDAVRTSLLSQRWRNLYRFVPNVELCCGHLLGPYYADQYPHDSNSVINLVDRFLNLRSGSKIHSFRLSCLYNSDNDLFEQWFSSLGGFGVEELFLDFSCPNGYSSDFSFSCHLLSEMPSKYFELSECYLQPSLRSQCGSLEILVLMFVTVCPGATDCILSNCMKLNSLKINNCKCPSKLSFRGPHLELKTLYISACHDVEEIEFYASNLVVFEFRNLEFVSFIFDHVPKLQSVFLHSCEKNIVPYSYGELAKDLPRLKSLNVTARDDSFQFLNTQMSNRRRRINMFNNLRRLDVYIDSRLPIDLLLLTPILQSCPILQEFHLNTNHLEYDGAQEEKQDIVVHSELKKMEISGFSGMENEIEFASYILRSAICLETMYISRCDKIYEGCGEWIYPPETLWSEEVRRMIHTQLQGQAVSETAHLIIQHEPCVEDSNWYSI